MRALISRIPKTLLAGLAGLFLFASSASADVMAPDGWVVLKTPHKYAELVKRVNAAAKANKIGVVTRASATVGAKKVLKQDKVDAVLLVPI